MLGGPMHRREIVLVLAYLAIATAGSSQRNAKAEECFSVASHVEARACLEARLKTTEAVLGEQEESCDKAISMWDQDTEVRNRTKVRTTGQFSRISAVPVDAM